MRLCYLTECIKAGPLKNATIQDCFFQPPGLKLAFRTSHLLFLCCWATKPLGFSWQLLRQCLDIFCSVIFSTACVFSSKTLAHFCIYSLMRNEGDVFLCSAPEGSPSYLRHLSAFAAHGTCREHGAVLVVFT